MPMLAPVSHHLDLYSYWLSKRGTRAIPARNDINPAEIPQLLADLLIVERADNQFRYRLIGSAIVRGVGYDATGVTVGSYLAAPEAAAEARAIFRRVFTAALPVFATGEFNLERGAHLSMSLLALPLSEEGKVVNMSIATLVTRFSAALKPEPGWLEGLPVKIYDVLDVEDAAGLEKFCGEWERCCVAEEPRPLD